MARRVTRGEIWTYRFKLPDKRRPVLVLSRPEVIPLLHTVMVAPITSTRRGAPSEVELGVEDGLKHDSAVNLDHVQTVEQARLVGFVGTLSAAKMQQVCRALALATGCA
ncbi:MAG: type II toxin-antitoxin system PemK/MazF family toxin [Acidobacteriota bacterium]|nr:type II toxin-antitoxin system PemK/MazF family toxin [Acidobacteriota bacterium]